MATTTANVAVPRIVGRDTPLRLLASLGLAAAVLGTGAVLSMRGTQQYAATPPAHIADRHEARELAPVSSTLDLSPRLHDDWPIK